MRRWVFGSLAVLLTVGMLLPAGMFQPAWANSELHFGSRLFYPLWDVRGNRTTFIVISREDLTFGNAIRNVGSGTVNVTWTVADPFDNCRPRGTGFGSNSPPSGIGNTGNVNRGSISAPAFYDDVHFEYYGKTCVFGDEIVHMSCADVDLFVLDDANPRPGFNSVSFEGVGALDAHLIINGTNDPRARKDENSLMGFAIISDVAEGWAAVYPAAAAKSTTCLLCSRLDGGTNVGYEPFPQEVFIPGVLADGFSAPGGVLSNLLSLWAPNLFSGPPLVVDPMSLNVRWWDGRERPFITSIGGHAIVRTIGDPIQSGQDTPTSIVPTFNVGNFTCGQATGVSPNLYEDDGIVGPGGGPDPVHPSDNLDNQGCTPIGTFRFQLARNGNLPNFPGNLRTITDNSGRGLVGVVLSSTAGSSFFGVGDAIRLWHKDPCELSQSANNFGPIHLRDASLFIVDAIAEAITGTNGVGGSVMTVFNALTLQNQEFVCALPDIVKECLSRNESNGCFTDSEANDFVGGFTQ